MTSPCCETCRYARFPADIDWPGICKYPPITRPPEPRCEVRQVASRVAIWRPGFDDCPVYEPAEAKP